MSTLQIRDVPEDIKQVLKVRAAQAGQSLSEYALAELRRSAERPTLAELTARIQTRGGPTHPLEPSAAEILRAERDAR
jgi:plasmid stability protein